MEDVLLEICRARRNAAESMPSMTAAINECMRFKPVGPVVIRQAAAADHLRDGSGCVVAHVCPGDAVIVNLAEMHRDPAIFPNPDTFDARANFLENPGLKDSQFRPFGHGRKGCVGLHLAQVEMRALLSCWLTTFRMAGDAGHGMHELHAQPFTGML